MDVQEPPQESPAQGDVRRLLGALSGIAQEARKLSWARERPWKTESHLWVEEPIPVIDLHDLSVSLAIQAVEQVVDRHAQLQSGAIGFITGVGSHSSHGAKLHPAVGGYLGRACADHAEDGWSFRADGPGRFVLITDPAKAPASVQTSLPLGFGWLLLALAGAALAALAYRLSILFS